jgi:hypothetical protein
MSDLAAKYDIPAEVMQYVDDGTLVVSKVDEAHATVEFDVPGLTETSRKGDQYKHHTLVWIRPDGNAEECHYYLETPGDLPNFYVRIDTENGDDLVDDLDTLDDLLAWLDEAREE